MKNFQLRSVLNIEEDLTPPTKKSLEDIATLCCDYNINPSSAGENLGDLLETQVKQVLFEHSYLNEKVAKRN